nr:unnamed protein product [Callosobruchus analis]
MDALYVIIEDERLSPLSFDSTQSTLIFPAQTGTCGGWERPYSTS